MTSPRRFTSGPPELPGLIDASVWMKFSYVVIPTSDRPVALTTPTVTVWSSPNGLPIAIAHSPTRSLSESPSEATVSGAVGSNRSEEHTSELQSRLHLVCRLLLEKKKKQWRTNGEPGTNRTPTPTSSTSACR